MELYYIVILIAFLLESIYTVKYKKSKGGIRGKLMFLAVLIGALIIIGFIIAWGANQGGHVLEDLIKWLCYIIGTIGILYYGALISRHY